MGGWEPRYTMSMLPSIPTGCGWVPALPIAVPNHHLGTGKLSVPLVLASILRQ